ncbi:MAG: PH domain-containing protein [Candidatus Helarchaeota archaeon]|nr:PH domain-containing protein [Candidatus Helarchaeota archaeon]
MKYFYWLVLSYIFFTIILILAIWVWILWIVSVIAYGVLAIPLFIQFIRWKSIYYKITDERIVIRKGILNINERSIMVDKIENFEVKRNIIDRILNTGDIIFFTEGEKQEGALEDVPKIRTVEDIITDLLGQRT